MNIILIILAVMAFLILSLFFVIGFAIVSFWLATNEGEE